MPFYSQIVEAYDELFPLNGKQLEFVEKALGGDVVAKSIMDIGCGTGALSIALARRSAQVRAFDFDDEMVAKAEEKRPQALDLTFAQGDMRTTQELYPKAKFDAALCFGNTLVHLSTFDEVKAVFKQVSEQLKEGGKFLFQIINYDRVLADKVEALPTIRTDQYSFVRNYIHRADGNIDFETILQSSDCEINNTVRLLALTKAQLDDVLQAFFTEVNYFGGFDGSDWRKESFHMVVEATR